MAQRSILRDLVAGPAPLIRDRLVAEPDPAADLVAEAERLRAHPIERGFRAGAAGMTAGGYAADEIDARLAGDTAAADLAAQRAGQYAQQAGTETLPEMDYRNVQGPGGVLRFIGGHAGSAAATMTPALVAGLVTRGRGSLRAPTAYAGAMAPSYVLERNEALSSQLQDPELAAMDPQRRLEVARAKGLAGGALEAIVPGVLAGGLGRAGMSPLRTIARASGQEAVTEAGQGAAGVLAQETLRRGSLADAMPALQTPEAQHEIINSALAGAAGGGGIALPTAATQGVANLAVAAGDRAEQAAKATADAAVSGAETAVDKAAETRSRVRQWADGVVAEPPDVSGMSDEELVGAFNEWATEGRVLPDDPAEVARAKSTDVEEILAADRESEATMPQRAAQAAEAIVGDEAAPLELRAAAERILRGEAPPAELVQLLGQAKGYQAGKLARRAAARGVQAIDDATTFMREAWDKAEQSGGVPLMITTKMREGLKAAGLSDEQIAKMSPRAAWERLSGKGSRKRNRQELVEDADLVRALHAEVKPEIQGDPEVMRKLAPMVKLFRGLDLAEPSRESYATMRRLLPALDIFQDPQALFARTPNVAAMYENLTRAQREAADDNSYLVANMTPAFRDAAPEARARLGQVMDKAAMGEETTINEDVLLERAFGSKGAVRTLVREYRSQVPALRRLGREETEGEDLQLDDEDIAVDASPENTLEDGEPTPYALRQQQVAERDALRGVTFEMSDPEGTRPFFAPRTVEGRRGARSALALQLRDRNTTDRSQRSRVVTLAEMAKERELSQADTMRYVESFLQSHFKQGKQDEQRRARAAEALRKGGKLDEATRKELDAIEAREGDRNIIDALIEQAQDEVNVDYDPSKPLSEQDLIAEAFAQALPRQLHVIRTERSNISGNTGADAPAIYEAGRKGITSIRKIKTDGDPKKERTVERLKNSIFTVYRRSPTGTERPTKLSAATIIGAARETTQSTGERDDAFTRRLFTEALGDLMTSDKTITRVDFTHPVTKDAPERRAQDLVLDAETGLTLGQAVTEIDAGKRDEQILKSEDVLDAGRERLAGLKLELEQRLDDLQSQPTDADLREDVLETLEEIAAEARIYQAASAMNAPTQVGRELYQDRYRAELPPAGMAKVNGILKQARAAASKVGKGNKGYGKIWREAFGQVDQAVLQYARTPELKLAARAKAGDGTQAIKLLRDEYAEVTRNAREDLRNLQADSSFGDSSSVDNTLEQRGPLGFDLPHSQLNAQLSENELKDFRAYGDFGEQLHGKHDASESQAKDRRGLGKRNQEYMALERARLGQRAAKQVVDYIESGILPNAKAKGVQAVAHKAVMDYIAADRATQMKMHKRWSKIASADTSGLAAQLMGRTVAELREARAKQREEDAAEVQRRDAAVEAAVQKRSPALQAETLAIGAERLPQGATDKERVAQALRTPAELYAERQARKANPPKPAKTGKIARANTPAQAPTNKQPEKAEPAKPETPTFKKGDTYPLALLDGRKVDVRVSGVLEFEGHQLIVHRTVMADGDSYTMNPSGQFVVTEPQTSLSVSPRNSPTMKEAIEATKARLETVGAKRFNEALAKQLNKPKANRQSTLERKKSGIGISRETKREISEEMRRIAGWDTKAKIRKHLFFVKAKDIDGASGEYSPAERIIKIAFSAVDPLGVAYHESLHDFIAGLEGMGKDARQLRNQLMRASEMPHIRAQLKELLKNHPEALKQTETDAEERLAYVFQFWAMGKHIGKPIIRINDKNVENAFYKLARWIRELLGVVSQDEKMEAVLDALYEGKFADRSVVAEVIHDMKLDTIQDKFQRISGPIADYLDKLMLVATDRLRSYGVAEMDELADMFMTEPGRESEGLRFIQRRARMAAKFDNMKADLFKDSTAVERATALRNLQSMKPPSTPLEKEIVKLLDQVYDYMVEAGVQRLNPDTKKWEPLKKEELYFPRVWDAKAILNNEGEFKQLLFKHGNVNVEQQNAIVSAIKQGDGQIELADSEYHVGFTPFASSVQDRKLKFINQSNAADFAKFQQRDIGEVLTRHIFQAVHRAEFARDFGNAGETIEAKFDAVVDKLNPEEILGARNAIKGLIGTLGADMSPARKDLYSAAITAQNVILLPLAIFSQFIDALGVGLRSQDPTEAWSAFKRGMGDFAKAVAKRNIDQPDYDTEMAKTIGLIDEQNMLEAMGQAHAGAFMSGFGRKINRKFFRWNGMEGWNRSMRVSAMVAGERFIQREIGNSRYMNELGLEQSDVMVKPDGRLAVTYEQLRQLGATDKQAKAREKKIQEALFRFVDGAVLRPQAANRPPWMSDPHWMLVAHLKQFAFAFQKTILARVNNEFEHGKVMPAAILAAYVPVMMASGLARSALTGTPIGDGGFWDLMNYGVLRSGILGTGSFGTDVFGDLERGDLPGSSLIGPTAEHVWLSSRFLVGDPEVDVGKMIDRSAPFARYF